ncbi:20231_t:CDS:2, partial [Cetraspora pellucida]
TIEPVLEEFGISRSKLVSIMTDNGSNVKAAVTQLPTKISPPKPVVNIFCAAHTLQLSVNVGLDKVHDLIIKCKALIRLLSREKKCKQLREAQISTDKKKTETINWNSTYIALKRLTKLERSIRWLVNDFENSTNIEHQHDGSNIREKLLSNNEFQIIRDFIDLLHLFHKAIEFLSGSNYTTLSIMVPTIEELINHLNNMNNEFDIINEVKNTILNNLISHWSSPSKYKLYAFLLDPRFKRLSFCSNINDLLDWWSKQKNQFPILSILARKYLAISATSIPSEWLFSDAGNHVTSKQNRLDPHFVDKLLFLKQNLIYVEIFPY